METRTKNRILGLSVFVGVILILIVFFQTGKDKMETTVLKAPPFPEVANQVNPAPEDQTVAPSDSTEPTETAKLPDDMDAPSKDPANPVVKTIKPQIINSKNVASDGASLPLDSTTDLTFLGDEDMPKLAAKTNMPQDMAVKNPGFSKKSTLKNVHKTPATEDDGLFKLTNAAWVIQIGSFKNKTNALKLVNQLRAKGFKAFIQQVSTSVGDSTRVFVGPEGKRAQARATASKLEDQLHIHGIVISYKPLTL